MNHGIAIQGREGKRPLATPHSRAGRVIKQGCHEINEYLSVNSGSSVPSAVQTISNSTLSAMLCPHQLHAEPVGSKRCHEINEYFSVNLAPSVPSAVQTMSNSSPSIMVRISMPSPCAYTNYS